MATLYAWATPTPFHDSPVDHTWVTDYDNRVATAPATIELVIAGRSNYWFCWGDFHSSGHTPRAADGSLGTASASVAQAQCLCASNLNSQTGTPSCGTIEHYGIDGVCHQLANQILWASGARLPPLTVSKARGYALSSFFYGTYGLRRDDWSARKAQCAVAPSGSTAAVPAAKDAIMTSALSADDEFAVHAKAALAKNAAQHKLVALLALRDAAQSELAMHKDRLMLGHGVPSGEDINRRHRDYLRHARGLLNEAEFVDLFGIASAQIDKVELVVSPARAKPRNG